MSKIRLTKLEILEYALEGAQTYRGLYSGQMDEEEEEQVDFDISSLQSKIERLKALEAKKEQK